MRRMFRKRTKSSLSRGNCSRLTNERSPEDPETTEFYSGAQLTVKRVAYINELGLIVAAGLDETARVYKIGSPGEVRSSFTGHLNAVTGICHVCKDVVASVGDDGWLHTWRAKKKSTENVDSLKVDEFYELTCIISIDKSRLVIGMSNGSIVVVLHKRGKELSEIKRIDEKHLKKINDVVGDTACIVTCSEDKRALIWNSESLKVVGTLRHDKPVRSVSIGKRRIVTVCSNANVYVYANKKGYPLLHKLITGATTMHSVSMIAEDILSLMGDHGLVSFASISKSVYVAHSQLPANSLYSQSFLGDSRMVVGGSENMCVVFKIPREVQLLLERNQNITPSTSISTEDTVSKN